MKTHVVNDKDGTRVPYLRGILTRSLLDAGMEFDAAFELATALRVELGESPEIKAESLRELVSEKLAEMQDPAILEHYNSPLAGPTRIAVLNANGNSSAFSRGRHERYLQSSGIRTSVAEEMTARIFDQLLLHGTESISTCRLGYLTYLCLRQEVGKKAARRYLVWSEFQRSERPLLLLIGGAVGTGKSSFTTEIAHRLEIVRTQSTDMLREVMRMMIPKRLLPVLHRSSFDAWRALPIQDETERDRDLLVAEGFRSQAELLSVPCEAVLHRAERENASVILEGVHVLPELVERIGKESDAVAVHVTLAVLHSGELKSRLRGRSTQEPRRRAKRYLKNFDSIWRLQSFLLSEADRHDAPIIANDERDKAIHQVILTINTELARVCKASPAEVFGEVVDELGARPEAESWQQLVPSLISG